jgi:hypothetical protein
MQALPDEPRIVARISRGVAQPARWIAMSPSHPVLLRILGAWLTTEITRNVLQKTITCQDSQLLAPPSPDLHEMKIHM